QPELRRRGERKQPGQVAVLGPAGQEVGVEIVGQLCKAKALGVERRASDRALTASECRGRDRRCSIERDQLNALGRGLVLLDERNDRQHVVSTLRQQGIVVAIRETSELASVLYRAVLLGRLALRQKRAL